MSAATLSAFIARCRVLCRPCKHVADAELLERFTRRRDADALGQLLERYAATAVIAPAWVRWLSRPTAS